MGSAVARRAVLVGVAVSFACAPDAPRLKAVAPPPDPPRAATRPATRPEPSTDAAVAIPEAVPDPPHFIGAPTRGDVLTGCAAVERASEIRACRNEGRGERTAAVLPLACWFAGERRWSSGSGCAVRRGLRFSPASPPADSARPWVTGGCYGSSLALGVEPDEIDGTPAVIVSPPEQRMMRASVGGALVPGAVLRAAVVADLKEHGFDLKPVWRTLVQSVATGIAITGDDATESVVAVRVASANDQSYGAIFWLPTGSRTPVRIDSMQWSSVEYELAGTTDLDGDRRRELVVRYAHESVGTSVYAWRDSDLALLGSTSCGP